MIPIFRSGLFEETAHLAEFKIALFEELLHRGGGELVYSFAKSGADGSDRRIRIQMRAARRFRDDAVDELQRQQIGARSGAKPRPLPGPSRNRAR